MEDYYRMSAMSEEDTNTDALLRLYAKSHKFKAALENTVYNIAAQPTMAPLDCLYANSLGPIFDKLRAIYVLTLAVERAIRGMANEDVKVLYCVYVRNMPTPQACIKAGVSPRTVFRARLRIYRAVRYQLLKVDFDQTPLEPQLHKYKRIEKEDFTDAERLQFIQALVQAAQARAVSH